MPSCTFTALLFSCVLWKPNWSIARPDLVAPTSANNEKIFSPYTACSVRSWLPWWLRPPWKKWTVLMYLQHARKLKYNSIIRGTPHLCTGVHVWHAPFMTHLTEPVYYCFASGVSVRIRFIARIDRVLSGISKKYNFFHKALRPQWTPAVLIGFYCTLITTWIPLEYLFNLVSAIDMV